MGLIRKLVGNTTKRRGGPKSETRPSATINITSPLREWVKTKKVTVSGWILPHDDAVVKKLRLKNNNTVHVLHYGVKRPDVLEAFPEQGEKALYSGFTLDLNFEDGVIEIEADLGHGWQYLYKQNIFFAPEDTYESIYNSKLSENMAEHQILQDDKSAYYYELASGKKFVRSKNDPKLICFYLPQYHPIKENNEIWGEGFTEWNNVASAKPRFVGHRQPILPSDFGFYDLRIDSNIKKQIDLAKKHGIYGFCFYYYWFSGHKLLDTPLNTFLSHQEWDFNFMIAWANENWTKRWDGQDDEVIISQGYLKDDPLNFIKDIEHILLDPRYIRIDGKPALAVYRPLKLKNPSSYYETWRSYFLKKHKIDLHIISVLSDREDEHYISQLGADAILEFEPMTTVRSTKYNSQDPHIIDMNQRLLDVNFNVGVIDYRRTFLNDGQARQYLAETVYRSIVPSWDNDARRKGKEPLVIYGSNPDLYAFWLDKLLKHNSEASRQPLIFINAWNEWAEGTMLEPTKDFGHAVLNRTTEILSKYSDKTINSENFPPFGIKRGDQRVAVILHLHNNAPVELINTKLKLIRTINPDIFITVSKQDEQQANKIKLLHKNAKIFVIPNRGKDILPFFILAGRLRLLGYEYILKIRSEDPSSNEDRLAWQKKLNQILYDKKSMLKILEKLEEGVAIIGPESDYTHIESERDKAQEYSPKITPSPKKDLGFFRSNMFWCSIDGIKHILDKYYIPEDFGANKKQMKNADETKYSKFTIFLKPGITGGILVSSENGKLTRPKLNQSSRE